MNKKIVITDTERNIILRNAQQEDNSMLREWKNRNRNSFFYKEEIFYQKSRNQKRQINYNL